MQKKASISGIMQYSLPGALYAAGCQPFSGRPLAFTTFEAQSALRTGLWADRPRAGATRRWRREEEQMPGKL